VAQARVVCQSKRLIFWGKKIDKYCQTMGTVAVQHDSALLPSNVESKT